MSSLVTTIDRIAARFGLVPKDRFGEPPTRGWLVVAGKEFADHLTSARFVVLLVILGLAAAATTYFSSGVIRSAASAASGTPSIFLRLFTVASDQMPGFVALVGFLLPLIGIAFGFDAINGERASGTLPRLLAQPIHRDDVINGKFVAGLATIATIVFALMLIVAGIGLVRLGIVPTAADVIRLLAWFAVAVVYVGFWLGFAMLCSVALRRAASSALVAIGTWLAFTLFAVLLVSLLAGVIAPLPPNPTNEEILANARWSDLLARLSPPTLFADATAVLLDPSTRTLSTLVLASQVDRAIPSTLSVTQSLLLAWPQVVALVALTVLSFAVAYVVFMRQEVRA